MSTQPAEIVGSDEAAVRAHLGSARFLAGVVAKRWRLVAVDWPYVVIAVTATPRPGAPAEVVIRFDLSGYPTYAPTGMPWDVERACQLEHAKYPKGDRVSEVFRTNWEGGRALYAAYDRVALQGHSNWPAEHPRSCWNAGRDLSFVLDKIADLLTSEDYLGV